VQNASNVSKADSRKPYPKPSYTQLPAEQARAFLLERANGGHQGAREMLELMFAEAKDSSGSAAKSATRR
jgi:hypothetical protein